MGGWSFSEYIGNMRRIVKQNTSLMIKIRKHNLLVLLMIIFVSCNDPNRIAVIDHQLSGCFGSGHEKLTVFKKDNEVIAILESAGKQKLETKLNTSKLDTLNLFLSQLRHLKEETGCTTVETYSVTTGNEVIIKEDGGCNWHGFNLLVKTFFNNTPAL
jgi:hypothetical protein